MNIYILTFGCALNQSDSERIAGVLVEKKHHIVEDPSIADVIIINSCTVKKEAESKLFKSIRKYSDKITIVAGCVPQAEKTYLSTKLNKIPIIGVNDIEKIDAVIQSAKNGRIEQYVEGTANRLKIPKQRINSVIEIVPICEGCLGAPCSFCKVKSARGNLKSFSIDTITQLIRHALSEGIKEIWLTAQDTGAFGIDLGLTIIDLLKSICRIRGDFKVRLGMANPSHLIPVIDELAEILNDNKLYRFIHIPVQSGSDRILEKMKRFYSSAEFIQIVHKLRSRVSHLTLATDLIVGFPGENQYDHSKSLELIKTVEPEILNISRFWSRPNTDAAQMDEKVSNVIVKKRSMELYELYDAICSSKNEKWINWVGAIRILENGKNGTHIGRNFAYKPLIVKGNYEIGQLLKAQVKSVTSFDLRCF